MGEGVYWEEGGGDVRIRRVGIRVRCGLLSSRIMTRRSKRMPLCWSDGEVEIAIVPIFLLK